MASGDSLLIWTAAHNEPPAANYATFDTRTSHLVLDFDDSTDEFAVFRGILPRRYASSGITVYLHYAMTSAVANDVVLTTAFERIGDGSQDIDSDGFATANTGTFTVPGTSGFVDIASIAHTDGAQIDSIAVGEMFRLKVSRDANAAGDTATGDLELLGIELKET